MEKIRLSLELEKFAINELNESEFELLDKAQKCSLNAYAPYSKFQVGASVLLEDGTIIVGNNQENAAYPSGLCAERTAIFAASANHPNKKILKIVVTAKFEHENNFLAVSPCGACRQVMLEYEQKQNNPIEFYMQNGPGFVLKSKSVANLLPYEFTKDQIL